MNESPLCPPARPAPGGRGVTPAGVRAENAAPPAPPRIGSLCTGYGGLDMAAATVLGARPAWHAQYDPADRHQYAARILEHRYPGVPNHGDITAADWTRAEPVEVLTAGFPCQPVSNAGLRKGAEDERWLWPEVARAVRVLRPRLVLLENVSALVVRGLGDVVSDLAALGYVGAWRCVRASDVGACHRRERIFIAAWPAAQDPDRATGGQRRLAAPGQATRGRAWPDPRGRGRTPAGDPDGQHARSIPAAGAGQQPARGLGDDHSAATHPARLGRGEGRAEPARLGRGPDAALGGGAAAAGGFDSWGHYTGAIRRWERALGRPAPPPVDDRRRLSPVFVEWLMGLPAGWVTAVPGIPRNAQLKALGNGVVPAQGAYAIAALLRQLPA